MRFFLLAALLTILGLLPNNHSAAIEKFRLQICNSSLPYVSHIHRLALANFRLEFLNFAPKAYSATVPTERGFGAAA